MILQNVFHVFVIFFSLTDFTTNRLLGLEYAILNIGIITPLLTNTVALKNESKLRRNNTAKNRV